MASVEVDGITRRFGRTVAVDDVSFTIEPGEVVGLLGPNGAGKTTTMRLMTGYLRPDAGAVRIGGLDVAADPVGAKRMIGYLPESSPVTRELTVVGYLRFCARLRRIGRREQTDAVESALSATNLGDVATQVIGSLSRGYRQRVGLAQALLHDPPVLVLDEPTVGLDPRQVAETRSLLARLGKKRAVLLSSHLLSEVATLCRRVVIINHGRVVATRAVAELAAESHQQRVEVRVRGDNAATDAALRVVKTLAAVRTAALHGQTIVAHGTSADLAEQISTALTQAGHVITALTSSSESLEDAYLRLVRD